MSSLHRFLPVGLLVFTGCASMTQSEIKFLESRDIRLPYATVYSAALNAMFSMGLSMTHTDKESGVIVAQSGDHAQRAALNALRRPYYPVKKVTLMVTPRSDRLTTLRIKVLVNEVPQRDRRLMTEIWQRLEREAMLDAPSPARTASRRTSKRITADPLPRNRGN